MKKRKMEKIEASDKEKLFIAEEIIKNLFGYNTRLDWRRWEFEIPKIIIEDVDWCEDLVTVLQRLRETFYISIEPETYEYEAEYEDGKKTCVGARFDIEVMNIQLKVIKMKDEKIVEDLIEARNEHKLRKKPGEVAIYDALIEVINKLNIIIKMKKDE